MRTRSGIAIFAKRLRWTILVLMLLAFGLHVIARWGLQTTHVRVVAGAARVASGLSLALASDLAAALFIFALWRLVRMLRRVEEGDFFSAPLTIEFRGFALFLFLSALASVPLPMLLAFIAAHGQADADPMLMVDFRDVWTLCVAGLMFLIARLFDEAQRLDADLREIV